MIENFFLNINIYYFLSILIVIINITLFCKNIKYKKLIKRILSNNNPNYNKMGECVSLDKNFNHNDKIEERILLDENFNYNDKIEDSLNNISKEIIYDDICIAEYNRKFNIKISKHEYYEIIKIIAECYNNLDNKKKNYLFTLKDGYKQEIPIIINFENNSLIINNCIEFELQNFLYFGLYKNIHDNGFKIIDKDGTKVFYKFNNEFYLVNAYNCTLFIYTFTKNDIHKYLTKDKDTYYLYAKKNDVEIISVYIPNKNSKDNEEIYKYFDIDLERLPILENNMEEYD